MCRWHEIGLGFLLVILDGGLCDFRSNNRFLSIEVTAVCSHLPYITLLPLQMRFLSFFSKPNTSFSLQTHYPSLSPYFFRNIFGSSPTPSSARDTIHHPRVPTHVRTPSTHKLHVRFRPRLTYVARTGTHASLTQFDMPTKVIFFLLFFFFLFNSYV